MPIYATRARITQSLRAAVGLATAALAASPIASAATNPAKYEKAQVGLTYTVYAPTTSIELKSSSFQLMGCGGGKDE